jgi:mannose-6-phosphate isomerase-like protein (cupin superfamily)
LRGLGIIEHLWVGVNMEQTHGSWGERLRTFQWDGGLCTILFLEPNQRCSWHCHSTAYNQFTVISGELGVRTDKGYVTRLGPKQVFTVEPGICHEFETYDSRTIVEEIAFVKYNEYDIQRQKLGGPRQDA